MAANNSNLFLEGMKTLPQRLSWKTEHPKLSCPPAKLSFRTDVLLCGPELGNRTGSGPLNSQSARDDHWTRSGTPVHQVLAHRIPKRSRKETVSLPSGLVLNATDSHCSPSRGPARPHRPDHSPAADAPPRSKSSRAGSPPLPGAEADLCLNISALAPRWSLDVCPGPPGCSLGKSDSAQPPGLLREQGSATSAQPAGMQAEGGAGAWPAHTLLPAGWAAPVHLPTPMPPSTPGRASSPGNTSPSVLPPREHITPSSGCPLPCVDFSFRAFISRAGLPDLVI